ncbi:MAG: class I SAM-dependent methyltransferase [Dysgonamonadaceae bacterium]|jgi:tRNA/tmRNA/rRNA uracil-C5-methylase (TrmA/RlmC/RlmD family)|nr:class I SAM-dependent methyltransferase [Dysgonamonadaceae bacterium]
MLNQATKDFIEKHLSCDVQRLALQFRPEKHPDVVISEALDQIKARRKSKYKIPTWFQNSEVIYPPLLSLEQSSSEITAKYKASLLSGNTFIDLTGGFGVDTAFIAERFAKVTYLEKHNHLVKLASHNFDVLGLNHIETVCCDNVEYLQKANPVDTVYIDPARRSCSGEKMFLLHDCEPDLVKIQDLLLQKADTVLIKLSPMLDIRSAINTLKNIAEIHVVSVHNENKELLFLLKKKAGYSIPVFCVNLDKDDSQTDCFSYEEESKAEISHAKELKTYLYEPNASLMKAGFYKSIALKYGVEKLHVNSHLYTSSELNPNFPGRIFEILSISSMNKRDLKEKIQSERNVHLTVRNFPLSVEELRKKLNMKEGGQSCLFATTLSDEKRVIIKTKQIFKDRN